MGCFGTGCRTRGASLERGVFAAGGVCRGAAGLRGGSGRAAVLAKAPLPEL